MTTTTTSPTFLVFTQKYESQWAAVTYSYNSSRPPSCALVVQSSLSWTANLQQYLFYFGLAHKYNE